MKRRYGNRNTSKLAHLEALVEVLGPWWNHDLDKDEKRAKRDRDSENGVGIRSAEYSGCGL